MMELKLKWLAHVYAGYPQKNRFSNPHLSGSSVQVLTIAQCFPRDAHHGGGLCTHLPSARCHLEPRFLKPELSGWVSACPGRKLCSGAGSVILSHSGSFEHEHLIPWERQRWLAFRTPCPFQLRVSSGSCICFDADWGHRVGWIGGITPDWKAAWPSDVTPWNCLPDHEKGHGLLWPHPSWMPTRLPLSLWHLPLLDTFCRSNHSSVFCPPLE